MALFRFLSLSVRLALFAGSVATGSRFRAARQVNFQNATSPSNSTVADTAASEACAKELFDKAVAEMMGDATKFANVQITVVSVKDVPFNTSYGGTGDDPTNVGFPDPIDLLPALCAVKMKVINSTDSPVSSFSFGIFLPKAWNWRILTVGGASFLGGVNWPDMAQGSHYGFATVSTDNGHESGEGNLTWAKDKGAQLDFGFRAMHGSVVVGKEVTKRFYGGAPVKSYYSGCSTGGRQGLREVQYDADTFDGLLIGAPAWDTVNMMPWISKLAQALALNGGAFTTQELANISNEARRQCDTSGSDTVVDNIISDPDACLAKFDSSPLVCKDGQDPTTCFDKTRLDVITKTFYGDYDPGGDIGLVSAGFDIGSENQWARFFLQPEKGRPELLNGFDMDYERHFLGNTSADVHSYSDSVVAASRAQNPGNATAPPTDLRPFASRGRKMLLYHGTADGLLPRRNTLRWYAQTKQASGGLDDAAAGAFLRYFEVPGMGHCAFANPPETAAPWMFGGAGQYSALRMLPHTTRRLGVPVVPAVGDGWTNPIFGAYVGPGVANSSAYDALVALVEWTEGGAAPERILAASLSYPARGRPICAFPKKAVLTNAQYPDSAAAWACQ